MYWNSRKELCYSFFIFLFGLLMEPIRDHKDFQGAVRNVKKGQNSKMGDSQKRQQSLRTFFKVTGLTQSVLNFSYFRVPDVTNQKQLRLQNIKINGLRLLAPLKITLFAVQAVLTFLTASLKSSTSIIGAIRYPDMEEV